MIKRTSLMSIVFIMSVILISGVFAATNSSWKKMGDRSNDILLNVAGSPVNISIDQNGSVLPVLDPTRDPVYITQTDDKKLVSFNINNDLYVMDLAVKKPEKVSSDLIMGFDKSKLKDLSDLEHKQPFLWVHASLMNNDGSFIVYESNRRGYENGNPHNDIWLKSLLTNEEKIAIKDGLVIRWVSPESFVYRRAHNAGIYNVTTGITNEVPVTDGFFDANEEVAVVQTLQSVYTIHFMTGEKKEIIFKDATTVYNGTLSQDGKQAAVFYNTGESTFVAIIDLENTEIDRVITPPAKGHEIWE